MKLPIRNRTDKPLRVFLEIYCDEYEVPPGSEAVVTLSEGFESIDFYEDQVTIWDNGMHADVQIAPSWKPGDPLKG